MKQMTRFFSLVLVLLMLLGSTAMAEMGENVYLDDIFPIVKEPVTIDIAFQPAWAFVTSEYDEDTFWEIQYLRKKTNLDLNFTVIDPSSGTETVTLMLASGDLPDLVLGYGLTSGDIVNYGVTQGLLRPINDLLPFMPTFSKILEEDPIIRGSITAPDGNIYAFPTMSNGDYAFGYRPWINKDWLKNVGMENPTTVDELYAVLKAFKEQDANGNGDPNDEIPLSGGWDHTTNLRTWLYSIYGLIGNGNGISFDYSNGKDGSTIVYGATTETYHEMLRFMNRLWTEGLIDPDFFTQSEIQANAKAVDGIVGLIGGTSPESMGVTMEHWGAMNALTVAEGTTPVIAGYAPIRDMSRAFISADVDDDKAAAIANLIDYYYTDLAYINNWFGPELGSEDDYLNNGRYFDVEAKDVKFKGRENDFWWNAAISNFVFWEVPGTTNVGNKFIEQRWAEANPDSVIAKQIEINGSYADWQQDLIDKALKYEVSIVPAMFMSEDDTEELGLLETQLDAYVSNCMSKFVIGEMNLDSDWESFQETLKNYGVETVVEKYNFYYDIFKANME